MERSYQYKKKLCNGLKNISSEKLNSIISDEELKQYCLKFEEKNFKAGERKDKLILDSHDFRYLESGDFKANLHAHTNYSDGLSSVKNLIEKANEIANKNGEFLIAITDHDTTDGCKEALKIICDNTDKYKNLKLVLGLEISTVGICFENQKQPVGIHLLVYGINPFDNKLNEFLIRKKELKLELAKKTINELNNELSQGLGYKFTLEEAALVHDMVRKGLDEVAHPLKKYTAGKILHNFYCPNSDFTYEKPIKAYKYLFKNSAPYYKVYKIALEKYLGRDLPELPKKIENCVLRAKQIYLNAHPTMQNKVEAISDFEETLKFISSLGYGYMCIAHPARTDALKIDAPIEVFYTNLFDIFKKFGKEKACFYEGYYQSYEGEKVFKWLPDINKAAKKFKLIPTGGLDSHGLDVSSRCPYT